MCHLRWQQRCVVQQSRESEGAWFFFHPLGCDDDHDGGDDADDDHDGDYGDDDDGDEFHRALNQRLVDCSFTLSLMMLWL